MVLEKTFKFLFTQKWTAVISEILIIVIGIFLGLQADAWFQERELRANIQLQLDRIQEDAIAIRDRTQSALETIDFRFDLLGVVTDVLDGEPITETNRSDFERGLFMVYQQATVDIDIPGLENLIDSGNINLIADNALREELLNYFNMRRTRDEALNHQLRLWDTQIEVILKYISRGFSDDYVPDPASYKYDLDELRGSREFN